MYVENVCLFPSEMECGKKPEWVWHDGTCISKMEYECKHEHEMEWTGTACISEEELKCTRRANMLWVDKRCQSALEAICRGANNVWKNGVCLDRTIYECEQKNNVWFESRCITEEKYKCEASGQNILNDNGSCIPIQHHHVSKEPITEWQKIPDFVETNLELWKPNIYKYAHFDKNKDGKIDAKELDELSHTLGSHEDAVIVSDLYNWRIEDLSEHVKKGFLQDAGVGDHPEKNAPLNIEYERFVKKLQHDWKHPVPKGSERVISEALPLYTHPLLAEHIILVSGGDSSRTRLFPALVHEIYTKFAHDRGYRFSFFNSDMASVDAENGGRRRVPYWGKIYLILDLLEHSKNRVIVWMDDDGIVSDRVKNRSMIEKYLAAYPDKDLIIAWDPQEYALLNSGMLIIRNTSAMKKLFHDVLAVGEETRCWIAYNSLVRTEGTLMGCPQSRNCLHEQQAIQELYIPMKRSCDSASVEWHHATDFPRHVIIDWKKHIALVPQWDDASHLNMNVFMRGIEGNFRYRRSSKAGAGPDGTHLFTANNAPFFLQCAGIKNKNRCIGEILNYLGLLTKEDIKRIIKSSFHEQISPLNDAYIEKTFEFSEWNYDR